MKKITALLFLFILLAAGVFASITQAQESESIQAIKTADASYQALIAQYRDEERAYKLAKEQYLRLQTLQSLDEAVQKTAAVMLVRAKALEAYLQVLQLTLSNTQGISLELKTTQLEAIALSRQVLNKQIAGLSTTTTRDGLATQVAAFNEAGPVILEVADTTVAMIAFGRLQTVKDKSLGLMDEVTQVINSEFSGPTLAQKERSKLEVVKQLDELQLVLTALANSSFTDEERLVGFSQISDELSDIYAQESKMLTDMKEVLGLND